MITQAEKGKLFASLHEEPGAFVIPNAWDAGSARLLQNLGFQALATTSAGFAFTIGKPDGTGAVTRDEHLGNARAIAGASSLPVSADLEGGFGDAPEDCAKTIRLAGQTGIVGGSIEDATGRRDDPIYDFEAAVERITAAAEAARALPFRFTLTARSENFLHDRPNLADTIMRLQAFQDAGADVLFAPGLSNPEDIATVVREVDRPVNVLMGMKGIPLTVEDLSQLGVKRISVGGAFTRAALAAFLAAAREVQTTGTFTFTEHATPHGELNAIFAAWPKN
ncbi:MAG TPA: isocitrate lyase/phosphoenolpyruvate mutase family protein [Nordella sp.]|nr:isocitrate lyase/phosphoenolpyruvate mutase family protein [Nordella sp.]